MGDLVNMTRRLQPLFPRSKLADNAQAKPSFRQINVDSIDPQELEAYPDRIVYQTFPWIKFVASTQYAEPVMAVLSRHDETLGYFTGLIVKMFGF